MPFKFDGKSGHFDECVGHFQNKKNPKTEEMYNKESAQKICATIMRKQEDKKTDFSEFAQSISVVSDEMTYLKSEDGNHFVNFYLTTDDIDDVNDLVTESCQQDIIGQLKDAPVMVKMGLEHDVYVAGDKRLLPHAKIIEVQKTKEDGKSRIKATAMLNKHHPNFENLWGSIKDGFLDATSIEYKPVDFEFKNIAGKSVRLLNKILLKGVTFTGRPINKAAKILDFFVKSQQMYDEWKSVNDNQFKLDGEIETGEMSDEEKLEVIASQLGFSGDIHQLHKGYMVEKKEHMDVTNGDDELILKIALAHIKEDPIYYDKLEKMEQGKSEISEGERMTEQIEEKIDEVKSEEVKTEEVKSEEIKNTDEMISISKTEFEEMKSKLEKITSMEHDKKLAEEFKGYVKEALMNFQPEIKSLVEDKDKFEKPINESDFSIKSQIQKRFGK
jgi:hypothetical protein